MRNLYVQILVLMMVVMVYTPSLQNTGRPLLQEMLNTAQEATRQTEKVHWLKMSSKDAKKLHVQYLLLMGIVMVCAASQVDDTKRKLLKRIGNEAKDLTEKNLSIDVPMITGNQTPCLKNFFCLAEQVLKETKKNHPNITKDVKNLSCRLHSYNKIKNVTCHLKTNGLYPIWKFLEEIQRCVSYTLSRRR